VNDNIHIAKAVFTYGQCNVFALFYVMHSFQCTQTMHRAHELYEMNHVVYPQSSVRI